MENTVCSYQIRKGNVILERTPGLLCNLIHRNLKKYDPSSCPPACYAVWKIIFNMQKPTDVLSSL